MSLVNPTPRKLWWLFTIPLVLWLIILGFYFFQFHDSLSTQQEVWGQFSDFTGGLINPIISLVGLYAVIVTIRANSIVIDETRRQLKAQMFSDSEGHYVTLEQLLASVPSALKFHGIEPNELKEAGISSEEFGYLMANFTAGGINVRALAETDIHPFAEGEYYRTMLESEHTRKAWKIIQKLMAPSAYKKRIQATIDLIENSNE